MKKKIVILISVLLISCAMTACSLLFPESKDFETGQAGEILDGNRDGYLIKVNNNFILFDDAGSDIDHLCKVNRKSMEEILGNGDTMDNYSSFDYFGLGNQFFNKVIDSLYSNDDYIIIIPKNIDKIFVIDCHKKISECMTTYDNINDIKIDYSDFSEIQCTYQ